MTLKEKLTYSFIAISIVLGSSAYAADNRDDSALIGSTSGAPNTHLPSADLALFDPESFKSGKSLLSTRRPQEKTAIPHAEAMHLPDAPLTSVSSSSAAAAAKKKVIFESSVVDHRDDKEKHMHLSDAPLTSVSSSSSSSSAAAAAKRGVVEEFDDGAEQTVEEATHLLGSLVSGFLPGGHLQVSDIPVTRKPSKEGSKTNVGLTMDGFDDDREVRNEEYSDSRDDRHGTRREDHHGDTHTLARRGEFQEPLGESRRDDSAVPDLLRMRSGTSRATYHEDEKLILELKLNLLRYGGLEEHNLVLMTDGLIESLLSNRLIPQQAGEVCIELLNSIYGLTHTVKAKKGEATALYSKRAKIVDYIRAKVTEDFTFINVLLKLADQDRFYRTVYRGLTRESVGLSAEEHLIFDKTKGGLSEVVPFYKTVFCLKVRYNFPG